MKDLTVLLCVTLAGCVVIPISTDSAPADSSSSLSQLLPRILQRVQDGLNPDAVVSPLSDFIGVVKNATEAEAKTKTGQLAASKLKTFSSKLMKTLGEATDTTKAGLKKLETFVNKRMQKGSSDVDHLMQAIGEGGKYLGNGTKEGNAGVLQLFKSLDGNGVRSPDNGELEATDEPPRQGKSVGYDLGSLLDDSVDMFTPNKADTSKEASRKSDSGRGGLDQASLSGQVSKSPSKPSKGGQRQQNGGLSSIANNLGGLFGSVLHPSKDKGGSDLASLISGLDGSYATAAPLSHGEKPAGDDGGFVGSMVGSLGGLFPQEKGSPNLNMAKQGVDIGKVLGNLGGIIQSPSKSKQGSGGGGLNLGSLLGGILGSPGKGGGQGSTGSGGGGGLGSLMGSLGSWFGG